MRVLIILFVLSANLIVIGCTSPPAKVVAPIEAAIKPIAPAEIAIKPITNPGAFAMLKREESMAAKVVNLESLKPHSAVLNDKERAQLSSLQVLATVRSFAGDHAGAIAAFDVAFNNAQSATLSESERALIADSTAEDALQTIVSAAKSRQIVILNEAHHVPMHRAFAMRLARELRKLGFEYLACEAFDKAFALPSYTGPLPKPLEKGYPSLNTGYYVRDPYFGQFLRETIQDGWKFVAYEHTKDDADVPRIERMQRREEGQANNLIKSIFRNNPKAKVFIYVGYSHAAKVALPNGESTVEWMAARLKSKTGIDPLTIDQTRHYARPDRARSSAFYLATIERHKQTMPFVMRQKSGAPIVIGYPTGSFDFQVVFPDDSVRGNTPTWRETIAGRRPVAIPEAWLPKSGRRMVYAFRESEPDDAVPVDVVLIEAGKPTPTFMLPKGRFRYAFED